MHAMSFRHPSPRRLQPMNCTPSTPFPFSLVHVGICTTPGRGVPLVENHAAVVPHHHSLTHTHGHLPYVRACVRSVCMYVRIEYEREKNLLFSDIHPKTRRGRGHLMHVSTTPQGPLIRHAVFPTVLTPAGPTRRADWLGRRNERKANGGGTVWANE